jgi:hypothetical protein
MVLCLMDEKYTVLAWYANIRKEILDNYSITYDYTPVSSLGREGGWIEC